MGKSNRVQSFLKYFDRYARPVTLQYKRSGKYETSIGGFCSILTTILLIYYLSVNMVDVFQPPGKFTTTASRALLENTAGEYPEMRIPMERLFTTYKIESSSSTIDGENLADYMVGLWFQ